MVTQTAAKPSGTLSLELCYAAMTRTPPHTPPHPQMSDLPFLLRLLDDPSPVVRERVCARLRALGEAVWPVIAADELPLSPDQRRLLEEIFSSRDERTLRAQWARLQSEADEAIYLEQSLLILGRWQLGEREAARAAGLLDDLAGAFLSLEPCPDSVALSAFLFDQGGLRGATASDYYNPLNSNLTHVLESGAGLPITLACVFILVGARVGLQIEGCNFPGHFLARDGRRRTVFDPFNGGRVLSAREVATLQKAAPAEMQGAATARDIIIRVLRNLSVAYQHAGETENCALMLSLLRALEDD